ncbi:Phthiocerol synthesis polyketide synthase type I PpsC [Oligella sp. MSHR50489EDL]|uniref:NAD(P)H-quinone oxidoreductase n=1 Tax=Oligella sp. MSHR50489EDL TaxID=3139409 RepID=UPI003D81963C
MKAIEINGAGGPDMLQLCEREKPTLKAGEVLIRVQAAGINRPDVAQREGSYPPPKGASDLPGLEVAGVIVAGDVSGTDLKIGDEVCALTPGGGYAEYVATPAAHCLPIPKGLSMIEAAGIPETFFTVWVNLFDRVDLAEGETVLIHGGASGIGTTAIQIAKAMGHTVYATAGSDERIQAIEALGCDKGINYKTQDFVEEIAKLTDKRGVDVILDMVAGDYISKNIRCLAEDGRLSMIAIMGGRMGELDAARIVFKRLTVTGSSLRPRSDAYKAKIARALQENVWPLIESGAIKPVVHAVFDYKNIRQAHEMMDAGEQIGKIIITFPDSE